MITKELTRATVEQGIAHIDDNVWWETETDPEFQAFAENFFAMGFQNKDKSRRSGLLEDILGDLEHDARDFDDEVSGAVMGKAVLLTFSRRQIVEDALSYLTRAARKGVKGAAVELCLWYAKRLTANDLASFPNVDVGLDDCYDPTPEDPRVRFPRDKGECRRRLVASLAMTSEDDFGCVRPTFGALTGSMLELPADKAAADRLLAEMSDDTNLSARLDVARRMIEVEGKVSEGVKLVRELAEQADFPEAWKYMLECHEKGVGPLKTNKFRRAAKAALTRIETEEPKK